MHPVLFEYGRFTVYTYGLFVALGFIAGIWLAGREAERRGLDPKVIQDLGFLLLVSAILGARLFFVLLEWRHFVDNPLQVFEIWKGGLVFYGGFVCAALAALAYLRHKHLSPWVTGDSLVVGLALAQALGRIGCFFAGCCYGELCDLPWAVTFHDPRGLAPLGVALHPTQLYSALMNLGVFAMLYLAGKRQRFDGQLLAGYLMLYPLGRFLVEFFRDDPRGALGVLSTSQALGVPLFLFGIWLWRVRSRSPAVR